MPLVVRGTRVRTRVHSTPSASPRRPARVGVALLRVHTGLSLSAVLELRSCRSCGGGKRERTRRAEAATFHQPARSLPPPLRSRSRSAIAIRREQQAGRPAQAFKQAADELARPSCCIGRVVVSQCSVLLYQARRSKNENETEMFQSQMDTRVSENGRKIKPNNLEVT